MKKKTEKQGIMFLVVTLSITLFVIIYMFSKHSFIYGIGKEVYKSKKCYEQYEILYCLQGEEPVVVDWYSENK